MHRLASIAIALALASTHASAVRAAEPAVPTPVIIQAVEPDTPSRHVDNLRFGVASFQGPGIANLFSGGQALTLGLDYNLGRGFAVALDSYELFQEYAVTNYWMSINPVELRYRVGLPAPGGGSLSPFATLGAGASLVGLMGAEGPKVGIGPALSAGIGTQLGPGLAIELGVHGGQVGQIPYLGWQVQLGSGFKEVASLWPRSAAAPPVRAYASASGEGRVQTVHGDRLVIRYGDARPPALGHEVLVFYEDGLPIKVARARVVEVGPGGRAVARVSVATEAVKPGYRVRGD